METIRLKLRSYRIDNEVDEDNFREYMREALRRGDLDVYNYLQDYFDDTLDDNGFHGIEDQAGDVIDQLDLSAFEDIPDNRERLVERRRVMRDAGVRDRYLGRRRREREIIRDDDIENPFDLPAQGGRLENKRERRQRLNERYNKEARLRRERELMRRFMRK